MLWELYQLSQIRQAQRSADQANSAVRGTNEELQRHVRLLEQDVEWLTLAVAAMAEILERRAGVSAAEIETVMREIDLRDGRADGKITLTPQQCGACGRPNGSRREYCLYCGAPLSGPARLGTR